MLNFSRGLLQIFHIFVCNLPGTFLQTNVQENLKSGSRFSGAVTPSNFFSRVLRNEALGYQSYFFQNSHFTEIIRNQILIQTLFKEKENQRQHYFEAFCRHGQVHPFGTFESFQSDLLAGNIFSIYSSSIQHQSSYGLQCIITYSKNPLVRT